MSRYEESGLGFALNAVKVGDPLATVDPSVQKVRADDARKDLETIFSMFDTDENGMVDAYELFLVSPFAPAWIVTPS